MGGWPRHQVFFRLCGWATLVERSNKFTVHSVLPFRQSICICQYVCPSVLLSFHLSLHMPVKLSVCSFVSVSVRSTVHLSVCQLISSDVCSAISPSVSISIGLSSCLSSFVHPTIRQSICPSLLILSVCLCPPVCLFVHQFVCMESVFTSFWTSVCLSVLLSCLFICLLVPESAIDCPVCITEL